jgi:hypothetical protein
LEILERINYVADLLETQRDSLSGLTPNPMLASPPAAVAGSPFNTDASIGRRSSQLQPTPQSLQYSEDASNFDSTQGDAEILLESLEIAGRSIGTSEDILDWPVFQGKHNRSAIEALISNPQSVATDSFASTNQSRFAGTSSLAIGSDPIRTSRPSRGVQEDDVMNLVHKFLTNVHIKNPVLDSEDLKSKARGVMENGFGWDATSCLVVSTHHSASSPEG